MIRRFVRALLVLVVASSCGSVGDDAVPDSSTTTTDCVLDTSTLDNCTL